MLPVLDMVAIASAAGVSIEALIWVEIADVEPVIVGARNAEYVEIARCPLHMKPPRRHLVQLLIVALGKGVEVIQMGSAIVEVVVIVVEGVCHVVRELTGHVAEVPTNDPAIVHLMLTEQQQFETKILCSGNILLLFISERYQGWITGARDIPPPPLEGAAGTLIQDPSPHVGGTRWASAIVKEEAIVVITAILVEHTPTGHAVEAPT